MDAPFDIERSINGETAERSLGARREHSAPLQADLRDWAHLQDRLVRDRGAALDLAPALRRERVGGGGNDVAVRAGPEAFDHIAVLPEVCNSGIGCEW